MINFEFHDKTSSKHDVVNKLSDHGITPTQQRILIAEVMLSKNQHLSADQILAKVNANGNLVSKATVYNTLALFKEKGLVHEVIVDTNKVFYDSNCHPHHHFYNVDTGTLHDISLDAVTPFNLPDPPDKSEIVNVDVIVRVRKILE